MKPCDFFYFNRSDRGILLFFLLLAIVANALIFFVGGSEETTPMAAQDSLPTPPSRSSAYAPTASEPYEQDRGRMPERFAFDPNTADSTALLRLGLQPWQVRNIYKYRAAGGVYRRPADFARLYGLTQKQYRELEPFIHISRDYAPAAELYTPEPHAAYDTTRRYPVKIGPTEHVDLNTSDTTTLKRVPGIGSYFARRIVAYRERLGGYHSAVQLSEIEDFPENAISFFIVSNNIRKINVNQLKLNELKRHPYINYYQAKAITDYRRLRGQLRSLGDLRLLKDFSPSDIERLQPYVEF
ncbi:MAG: helix-hairpin-helix domain-containing protein [Prevotella sp.]|nr:helix-hairpin-helix domain-containing protein [Prevotella sp.]